ncbi:zinc-dependent alcohol dehydrogenase family protein [Yoonia sp. SS1-5]|uniref:enoyl-[acyl-carrier-protein] reductase n=1 Tax=Yoonia rhodophyticola TaxID=3137370 RepID=A0AAN0NHZ5_9RHOB
MKQAIYRTHGKADQVVELIELDPQPLERGQTRLKILRAPINPSDILQIAGNYGSQPALPAQIGLEGVGEVMEVHGPGLGIGTRVIVPNPPGAWATEKTVPSAGLVPLPDADLDQLAMLIVNPATAYLLLTKFVDLVEGDWIIQSAATSAVGQMVTQLAKARGVRIASVVRRSSAIEAVKTAGADAVLLDGPDLTQQVTKELDQAPVLAIDAVAGETFGRLIGCLQDSGTIVLFGNLSGQDTYVPDQTVIFRDIKMRGFWLTQWLQTTSPKDIGRVFGELTTLVAMGQLHSPVARVYPLEDIHKALSHAMRDNRAGKVLLAPNGL